MPRTGSLLAGSALLAAALVPASASASAVTVTGPGMAATIRYTEYGIPHITARDYAGLGYGTGYAAAKDNICLLAQGVVTLRGERSRYFGASASPDGTLSSASTNLASDVFFTAVNDSGIVERLAASPNGPTREIREMSRGWAAGYNRFLREGRITDPVCEGAAWLRPITELDVHRRGYALAMLGGSGLVTDQIAAANPPAANAARPRPQTPEQVAEGARNLMTDGDMYVIRNGEKIPLGGGTEALGILNKLESPWIPGKGYPEVTAGSSYVQVVSFDGDRCPDTRTLLTYSQSADPTSPHYADQTRLFSGKKWVTERFCPADITGSPALRTITLKEK